MTVIASLPVTLANGTTGDATQVMNNFNSIVSQVNANAMSADGTVVATANQNMGGHKITALATGTAGTDAVNLNQVNALTPYSTCMVIVYLAANTAIAEGTLTEVGSGAMTFTTVLNVGGLFNTGTGRFRPAVSGVYLVSFFGTLDTISGISETKRFNTYFADSAFTPGLIFLNGSTASATNATASSVITSGGTGLCSLSAGVDYSMWVLHDNDGGTGKTLEGGFKDTTQISIMRIT